MTHVLAALGIWTALCIPFGIAMGRWLRHDEWRRP